MTSSRDKPSATRRAWLTFELYRYIKLPSSHLADENSNWLSKMNGEPQVNQAQPVTERLSRGGIDNRTRITQLAKSD